MSPKSHRLRELHGALSEQSDQIYVMRLYVSGATLKSREAVRNVRNICESNLAGKYRLEVVDIYQHPERAALDQVVAVPVLVKELPLPRRQLIGTLSNSLQALRALGVMNTDLEVPRTTD
jgi:circadian clock protein KaiB